MIPEKQIEIFEEIFRAYEEISEEDLDELLQVYDVNDAGMRARFTNHFLLIRTDNNLGSRFQVLRIYFVARFLGQGVTEN